MEAPSSENRVHSVKTGYIRHIPPGEVMSERAMVTESLCTIMIAVPDFVSAQGFSSATSERQLTDTVVKLDE
jgi:hypothetical protein